MQTMTEKSRGVRRQKEGVVVSDKMERTVVVKVETTLRHPKYQKVITRGTKYYAHDESNEVKEGDRVVIMECRPYSKTKKWLVIKKIEGNS